MKRLRSRGTLPQDCIINDVGDDLEDDVRPVEPAGGRAVKRRLIDDDGGLMSM